MFVKVTMRVDGKYPERWRTVGTFTYLASSFSVVGGTEGREVSLLHNINNLVGCIKDVLYTTDTLRLDLLKLAEEGSSLMSVAGDLEWSCQDVHTSQPLPFRSSSPYQSSSLGYYLMQQGGVISFSDSQSYLVSAQ